MFFSIKLKWKNNFFFFFYSEGYIRTSSEIFDIDPKTKADYYMHLTNNAVQKNSENYGKFELGNQLSFHQLEVKNWYFFDFNPQNIFRKNLKKNQTFY